MEVKQQTKDNLSVGLELLTDINDIMKSWDQPEIPSKTLLNKLISDEELDWSQSNYGRPISFKWLANKLKPSKIFPYKRRDRNFYSIKEIRDATSRYLGHTS